MEVNKEILNDIFHYQNGSLFWKKITGRRAKIGDIAGRSCSNGYRMVGLFKRGYLEHRLIFMFHHGYFPKEVDHIDGDKLNNRADNLEWVSSKRNALHSTRVLKKNIWENHNLAKLTEGDVIDMRVLRTFGATYADMARAYNVSEAAVSNAVKGKTWVNRKYA